MQHLSYLVGLGWCLALWLAYIYGQHWEPPWLFAIVIRLRRARKARGWSIEEAAWQVGVNTSTYHRWELGVQRPHGRNLHKLEAAFQMKASYLFEKDSLTGARLIILNACYSGMSKGKKEEKIQENPLSLTDSTQSIIIHFSGHGTL